MVGARLVPILAIAAVIGLSACGGGGDEPAPGEFVDGACVDRTSASGGGSGLTGMAGSGGNPAVVDCDSPDAAGVLRKVERIEQCPTGTGIGVFSISDEKGAEVDDGSFCIEPN
jgi:hypothetical protein